MNNLFFSLIAFICLFVSGCAQTYGPESTWHRGYINAQLDQNTFNISYEGMPDTPSQTVENFLLYRCAELTWQNGFDYFIILEKHTSARHDQNCDQTMNTVKDKKGRWTTSTSSGTIDCQETVSYTVNATIKAYKGKKPGNNPMAYNAHELMLYLNSQINR